MAATPKSENNFQDNTPARQTVARDGMTLPFILGRGRVAAQPITPVLHWRYRNTSKSSYAFFSCLFEVCLGPVDEIARVFVNGKPYTGVFVFRDASPGDSFDHVMAKETPETFTFWWGNPTQTAAAVTAYAQGLVLEAGHSEAAALHPSYKGRLIFGVKDMEAGQAQTGFTPSLPNIEVEVYRRAPIAYDYGHDPKGTHPVGAIYELMTDTRGGLGLPLSLFNSTRWQNAMDRMMSEGAAGKTGFDTFISPVFAEQREASQGIADCLSYFDGWLTYRNGQIDIDWYPNDGSTNDATGLRELSIHDMIGQPSLDPDGLDDLVSKIAVTGLDWENDDDPLSEATEVSQVPYARQVLSEPREEKINRPYYLTRDQLRTLAAITAALKITPRLSASAKFRRESCTQPDDVTPLQPGDRFNFDYGPMTLDVVCRIIERTESADKAEVTLKFISERGASPQPYIPPVDPRSTVELPDPQAPAYFEMAEAPPDLELPAGPSVIPLAERENTYTSNFRLHFSPTNSFPGQIILDDSLWSISGVVTTGLSNVSTPGTLTVTIGSDEVTDLISQSATEKEDNTLLLYAGGEWLSVGTITPLGGGSYDVAVLRGRLGSTTRAISTTERLWFLYKDEVPIVAHKNFQDVGIPYNGTTATKYFKLEGYTGAKDATITSAVSLVLADRAPGAVTSLVATGIAGGIRLTWVYPVEDIDRARIYESATATKPADPSYFQVYPEPSYTRFGLSGGTVRYYWVELIDAAGNISASFAGPVNATALSGTAGADGYWFEADEVNFVQCDSAGTAKAGELGGSGRVRSTFKVFKGTTALTATGSTPGAGQFRVVKIADTNCTTTYSGGYVIELTTISAASGNTEYKIELEGTSTFVQSKYHWSKTLDGTAGTPGVSPPGFWATSTSSVTIGTGSKVFNIGAGYGYFAGMRARAIDQANSANWVEGLITGYSSPNLTINVDLISGSGTKTAWNIGIAGEIGNTGATGATGSTGAAGTNGTNGTNGAAGATGNYLVRIYQTSATVPSTPSAVNSPAGWSTTIPAVVANQATYVSEAYFNGATNNLIGTWSTPARLPGNLTFYASAFPTGIIATGDYCFRTDLENELYRYNGSTWDQVSQKVYADDFGTGVRPVQLVASNPALPNASYPTGSVIFNSTDGKLYRNNAGAWTAATPTSDLTGTIAAGQIAANAVTAGTIAANAVTAGTIAAGVVTATTVGTNQIIASSANVANAVITNAHIVTIDAGKLTAGTISAVLSLTTGGEFRAGTGDAQLRATSTGTTIGDTSDRHLFARALSSGATILEGRFSTTAYATFGAYSLGGGVFGGQVGVSSSTGFSATLTPLALTMGGVSITRTGSGVLTCGGTLLCTGGGLAQINSAGTLSNFVCTQDVSVDVYAVNLRVFDASSVQKFRVDNTNGRVYIQNTQILRERYATPPTTTADLIALCQYHGLCA